jgi:cell division protein ZapA (FtsZ GTPase activity inhibitor)
MNKDWEDVTLHIMNQTFQIRSQSKDVATLKASSEKIEKEIRSIHQEGKIIGPDRVVMMAALRLVFQLLSEHAEETSGGSFIETDKVEEMVKKLKKTISKEPAN